jgi:hypothetical protein
MASMSVLFLEGGWVRWLATGLAGSLALWGCGDDVATGGGGTGAAGGGRRCRGRRSPRGRRPGRAGPGRAGPGRAGPGWSRRGTAAQAGAARRSPTIRATSGTSARRTSPAPSRTPARAWRASSSSSAARSCARWIASAPREPRAKSSWTRPAAGWSACSCPTDLDGWGALAGAPWTDLYRAMPRPRRVHLSTIRHETDEAGLRYVYAVLSRRAGGVSIGVNVSTNHACNWRCVYCQVPGLVRGTSPPVDLDILEQELKSTLEAARRGELFDRGDAKEAPEVVDVAFSGDGEPTTSPDFGGAVERVGKVLREAGLSLPVILITNGSRVASPPRTAGAPRARRPRGRRLVQARSGDARGAARDERHRHLAGATPRAPEDVRRAVPDVDPVVLHDARRSTARPSRGRRVARRAERAHARPRPRSRRPALHAGAAFAPARGGRARRARQGLARRARGEGSGPRARGARLDLTRKCPPHCRVRGVERARTLPPWPARSGSPRPCSGRSSPARAPRRRTSPPRRPRRHHPPS